MTATAARAQSCFFIFRLLKSTAKTVAAVSGSMIALLSYNVTIGLQPCKNRSAPLHTFITQGEQNRWRLQPRIAGFHGRNQNLADGWPPENGYIVVAFHRHIHAGSHPGITDNIARSDNAHPGTAEYRHSMAPVIREINFFFDAERNRKGAALAGQFQVSVSILRSLILD